MEAAATTATVFLGAWAVRATAQASIGVSSLVQRMGHLRNRVDPARRRQVLSMNFRIDIAPRSTHLP